MDAKEEKWKRDRERYAQMTEEEKKEKLKKQREYVAGCPRGWPDVQGFPWDW